MNLASVEHHCMDLNNSYKFKSKACCELEERYETDINKPNSQLVKCREDKARLQEEVNRKVNIDSSILLVERRENIVRLCSAGGAESSGVTGETAVGLSRQPTGRDGLGSGQQPTSPYYSNDGTAKYHTNLLHFLVLRYLLLSLSHPLLTLRTVVKNVLLIRDSYLRYASRKCVFRGAYLKCCSSGKSCFQSCTAHLYTDYCQLHFSYDLDFIDEAIDRIHSDLVNINSRFFENGLKLNMVKCSVLHLALHNLVQALGQ
ncbi:hypothetical protein J6590_063754 [Homalodisca vitripennis]|nr:hypothetical protein J6590_063754 [Homalodisca vitripennis]